MVGIAVKSPGINSTKFSGTSNFVERRNTRSKKEEDSRKVGAKKRGEEAVDGDDGSVN